MNLREIQALRSQLGASRAIEAELRTRISQLEGQAIPQPPPPSPTEDDSQLRLAELSNNIANLQTQIEDKDQEIALLASRISFFDSRWNDTPFNTWTSQNGSVIFSRLEIEPLEPSKWRLEIIESHSPIPLTLLAMNFQVFDQLNSLPEMIILSCQSPFDAPLIVHLTSTQMMCWKPSDASHLIRGDILAGGFQAASSSSSSLPLSSSSEPSASSVAEPSALRIWFKWKGSNLQDPNQCVTFRRKLRHPLGQPKWKSTSNSPQFEGRWLACFEEPNAVFLQLESDQTMFILLTTTEGYLFQKWYGSQLQIDPNPVFSGKFKSITPSLKIPTEINSDSRASLIVKLEAYAGIASVGMIEQHLNIHLPVHVTDDPTEDPSVSVSSQVALINTLNDFVRNEYLVALLFDHPSKKCSISGSLAPVINEIVDRFELDRLKARLDLLSKSLSGETFNTLSIFATFN